MKYGFDNAKYLKIQSEHIKDRIATFGDKLYMEFGGKLFDDFHASRVLPGFEPDSKLKMLMQMKDDAEIVIVISAVDIQKNKVRTDLGITYDMDVLRLRDEFMERGLSVNSIVITHFSGQSSAVAYRKRLENMGIKVYYHHTIEGYPHNVALIDSDEGFGRNDYVETTKPLVVITAPGPGSGKMAVCLSQLYQENKRGVKAGYAKFETFPIWNLSLTHPVNLAYEAATADLEDVNMIDPFHLEAYGKTAVNYNRDVEIFPVMNALFMDIYGESPYKSPTDMGVNMAGYCISDDEVCREASLQEIVRRYYTALCNFADGKATDDGRRERQEEPFQHLHGYGRHRTRGRYHPDRRRQSPPRPQRRPAAELPETPRRHRTQRQAHPPDHDRPHPEDQGGLPARQEPPPAYGRGAGGDFHDEPDRRKLQAGARAAAQAAGRPGTFHGHAQ